VWHMYLADVANTRHAVDEHLDILEVLRSGDADASAAAIEAHVRAFDEQVRSAVTNRLAPPLAV
jgi:DNA-binding GntR family transcriptional regulator